MKNYMTVEEVAKYIKVHPLTVRRWIREKKMKAYHIGRTVRIVQEELDKKILGKG